VEAALEESVDSLPMDNTTEKSITSNTANAEADAVRDRDGVEDQQQSQAADALTQEWESPPVVDDPNLPSAEASSQVQAPAPLDESEEVTTDVAKGIGAVGVQDTAVDADGSAVAPAEVGEVVDREPTPPLQTMDLSVEVSASAGSQSEKGDSTGNSLLPSISDQEQSTPVPQAESPLNRAHPRSSDDLKNLDASAKPPRNRRSSVGSIEKRFRTKGSPLRSSFNATKSPLASAAKNKPTVASGSKPLQQTPQKIEVAKSNMGTIETTTNNNLSAASGNSKGVVVNIGPAPKADKAEDAGIELHSTQHSPEKTPSPLKVQWIRIEWNMHFEIVYCIDASLVVDAHAHDPFHIIIISTR
jgi:hypothetical protein